MVRGCLKGEGGTVLRTMSRIGQRGPGPKRGKKGGGEALTEIRNTRRQRGTYVAWEIFTCYFLKERAGIRKGGGLGQ